MDKQLIKLYCIMIASLALIVLFLPVLLGKTSELITDMAIKAQLLFCSGNNVHNTNTDKNKGVVVFIFDDGWETQYTKGYKILNQYGFKANIAVVPTRVGTEGYMSYRQLADVYRNGWDLLNHTYDHLDLRTLTAEDQQTEINKGRAWLGSHFFSRGRDIVVFPGSYYTASTLEILKNQKYIAARSLENVWIAQSNSMLASTQICNLCSSETVQRAQQLIDIAIQQKSTLLFVLHKIEPVADQTQMQFEPERLETIVKYVSGKKEQLNILTFTELLEYYGVYNGG